MDLFGHSASGGICLLYGAEHPNRLDHLVLANPSLRVVGIQSDLGVDEVLSRRAHEPWYTEAVTALHAEAPTPQDLTRQRWLAAPLLYAHWNAAAQAHAAAELVQFAPPATDGFYAGFEPDPALPGRLTSLTVPTLLVSGGYDIWPTDTAVRELAALLGNADTATLPNSGHFPWFDDPATFTTTVDTFLTGQAGSP
jgi:pimeloyl-ACP methyl ester carboxylesterase